ncbi:hypothetical protein C8R46DRAFT_1042129 [Mycena filopes]|nr:hypothetical protein C8R46DRAFT_1042129 [Mycena filopes]
MDAPTEDVRNGFPKHSTDDSSSRSNHGQPDPPNRLVARAPESLQPGEGASAPVLYLKIPARKTPPAAGDDDAEPNPTKVRIIDSPGSQAIVSALLEYGWLFSLTRTKVDKLQKRIDWLEQRNPVIKARMMLLNSRAAQYANLKTQESLKDAQSCFEAVLRELRQKEHAMEARHQEDLNINRQLTLGLHNTSVQLEQLLACKRDLEGRLLDTQKLLTHVTTPELLADELLKLGEEADKTGKLLQGVATDTKALRTQVVNMIDIVSGLEKVARQGSDRSTQASSQQNLATEWEKKLSQLESDLENVLALSSGGIILVPTPHRYLERKHSFFRERFSLNRSREYRGGPHPSASAPESASHFRFGFPDLYSLICNGPVSTRNSHWGHRKHGSTLASAPQWDRTRVDPVVQPAMNVVALGWT